jgi:hypothetical protein
MKLNLNAGELMFLYDTLVMHDEMTDEAETVLAKVRACIVDSLESVKTYDSEFRDKFDAFMKREKKKIEHLDSIVERR